MSLAHSYETTARLVRAATGQTPTADGLPAAYRTAITKLRPHPARPGITVSYEDGE
jgi:hypothetical protein